MVKRIQMDVGRMGSERILLLNGEGVHLMGEIMLVAGLAYLVSD